MTATREDWLRTYEALYDALPDELDEPCPNCGAKTLRLVFTGNVSIRAGYANLWCDTCMQGIHLSRVPVPDGVPMMSSKTPVPEREVQIPEYTIVEAEPVDDEDDEDTRLY